MKISGVPRSSWDSKISWNLDKNTSKTCGDTRRFAKTMISAHPKNYGVPRNWGKTWKPKTWDIWETRDLILSRKNGTFEGFGGTEEFQKNVKTKNKRDTWEIQTCHVIQEKRNIRTIRGYRAVPEKRDKQTNPTCEKFGTLMLSGKSGTLEKIGRTFVVV